MINPPPWSIETVLLYATTPANRTTPSPIARTVDPPLASMSIPQCPAHRPIGAKPRSMTASSGIPIPKQPNANEGNKMRTAATN